MELQKEHPVKLVPAPDNARRRWAPPATPSPPFPYRYTRRRVRRGPWSSPGGSDLTKERATGRDIVLAIGENMRQSLEPLVTKTIAPSLYQVYLHADDYDRLRSLFGELEGEAKALLDKELERLNRGSAPAFPRILRKKKDEPAAAPQYVSAE